LFLFQSTELRKELNKLEKKGDLFTALRMDEDDEDERSIRVDLEVMGVRKQILEE